MPSRRNRPVLLALALASAVRAEEVRLPRFLDITKGSGVEFVSAPSETSQKYLPTTMLGGVAMLDYDSDGLLDLFFVNGAQVRDPMPAGAVPDKSNPRYWDRLYRNLGDGRFEDVTEKAGLRGSFYGQGAAVGDYDNDGDPDLYVTGIQRNALYRNEGDGSFREVAEQAGAAGGGWSTSAAFVDFDADGLLDLAVARYVEWSFAKNPYCGDRAAARRSYCHPDEFVPLPALLYRNRGDGTFEDVSKQTGLGASLQKSLGIAINDYDGDGRIDLFFANDSWPQHLFRNGRDGFAEQGLALGVAYDDDGRDFGGMGTDFQDYDNDGRPDLFVNALSRQGYHLYRNEGGAFAEVSIAAGVAEATRLTSGWGATFLDFDNDGWKDLFVAQGHVMDNIEITQPGLRYREPPMMLRNEGGKFRDVSMRLGAAFQEPLAARGSAVGDLDNDGSLDLVVYRNGGPPLILRNEGARGEHWLLVELEGVASNRDAIGAVIRVVADDGSEQYVTVSATGGYLSARDRRAHFGLRANARVKLMEIRWPSGLRQKLEGVAADQTARGAGATAVVKFPAVAGQKRSRRMMPSPSRTTMSWRASTPRRVSLRPSGQRISRSAVVSAPNPKCRRKSLTE